MTAARATLLAIAAASCGGPSSPATDAPSSADATAIDAPPAIDAMLPDLCKHRTAPAGVPEGTYPPESILDNSLVIRSQVDVDALAGIRVITGSLDIAAKLDSITLPDLEVVEGSLTTSSPTITELRLPKLETVGVAVRLGNAGDTVPPLAVLDLGRLESTGAYLYVHAGSLDLSCLVSAGSASLIGVTTDPLLLPRFTTTGTVQLDALQTTTVSMRALTVTTDVLEVNDCLALTDLHLGTPTLLDVANAPALTTITMTSNAQLRAVGLARCGALADVDFLAGAPALATLGLQSMPALHDLGALDSLALTNQLSVVDTGVTAIHMPNISALAYSLRVSSNPSLVTLDLPALTSLGPIEQAITDNPMLPTCQAQAIKDRVTVMGGNPFVISGNGSGSCP